jgi:hypothetical protein
MSSTKYDDDGPLFWPVCTTCNVARVLRKCYSLRMGTDTFMWRRNRKHRSGGHEIVERS